MVGVAFGVQFVVGADHDVGLNFCDDFCDFDAERDFVVHAAVLKRQKSDVLNAQNFRGCQLFVAADFNKRFGRHVFVFRAEPSVGANEIIYGLPFARKPCDGAAHGNFDIVGVRRNEQIRLEFFDFRNGCDRFYEQSVE